MNCDSVFDVLTRGRFPTGDQKLDDRVEVHLTHCPTCRQLAEALRPAVDLFGETIDPSEGQQLPAYWGRLLETARREGHRSAKPQRTSATVRKPGAKTEGARRRGARRAPPAESSAWRWAAAVLLGVLLGGLLRTVDVQSPFASRRESMTSVSGNLRTAPVTASQFTPADPPAALIGKFWLPTRGLLTTCRSGAGRMSLAPTSPTEPGAAEIAGAVQLAAADLGKLRCCTNCHHSGGLPEVAEPRMAELTSSCRACHQTQ